MASITFVPHWENSPLPCLQNSHIAIGKSGQSLRRLHLQDDPCHSDVFYACADSNLLNELLISNAYLFSREFSA